VSYILAKRHAATSGRSRRLRCDLVIHVGDDDIDEDTLVRARTGRLPGIRICHRHLSKAACFLKTPEEIDTFLRRLVELRPAQGGW
jgi:hypothetical protein